MVRSVCECGKIHNNLQIPIVCECGKKRQIQKEPIKVTHGFLLNPPLHVKALYLGISRRWNGSSII